MQIIHHLINESGFKVITINLFYSHVLSEVGKKGNRVIFSLMETEYVSGFPMIV